MPNQQTLEGLVCWICNAVIAHSGGPSPVPNLCTTCTDDRTGRCVACADTGWLPGCYPSWDVRSRCHDLNRDLSRWATMVYVAAPSDDDEYYCDDCVSRCSICNSRFSDEENSYTCCEPENVHNYGYRPSLMFWTTENDRPIPSRRARPGVLYMGMEVEMERAAEHVTDFLRIAGEDLNNPQFCYFKHDGSLDDSGVELITMPATLDAFMGQFPWDALANIHDSGARAWHRHNCGLHVHVSRSAFTPTHMWKFLKFQYYNSDKCVIVAGRNSDQWASWSNSTMREQCNMMTAKVVKDGRLEYSDRYSAINLINRDTIELRYFRPNLRKQGLMRIAEFVDALFHYTKQLSYSDLLVYGWSWIRFVDWMSTDSKYDTISRWIAEEIN